MLEVYLVNGCRPREGVRRGARGRSGSASMATHTKPSWMLQRVVASCVHRHKNRMQRTLLQGSSAGDPINERDALRRQRGTRPLHRRPSTSRRCSSERGATTCSLSRVEELNPKSEVTVLYVCAQSSHLKLQSKKSISRRPTSG